VLPNQTFPVLTPEVGAVVMALSDEAVPVVLALGEPGVGKRHAVTQILSKPATDSVVVGARADMGPRSLAEEMLRDATGDPFFSVDGRSVSRGQLTELVNDLLYEEGKLFVIDDAHMLPTNTLAWLAHLQTRGVGRLVLIGDPSLTERLPEELCRVARSILFERIPKAMIPWLVRQLHPIYFRTPRETLLEIDRRYCEGIFERWARFTEHAAMHCSCERIPYVDDSVIDPVLDFFEEFDEEEFDEAA
jgi:hypothetical protein